MTSNEQRTDGVVAWSFLAVSVLLGGIHLYLALISEPATSPRFAPFLLIAVVFLLVPAVYFTSYWRSLLYLLAALFAVTLGVLWVLEGMPERALGLTTGVLAVVYVSLAFVLFVRAEGFAVTA